MKKDLESSPKLSSEHSIKETKKESLVKEVLKCVGNPILKHHFDVEVEEV